MMVRRVVFALVGLLSVVVAVPAGRAVSAWLVNRDAKLSISPSVVLVPVAFEGERATREVNVSVRNTSPESVDVVGAKSSCGCLTSASQFPIQIAPGGEVRIKFSIEVIRGRAVGSELARAAFFLNDSSQRPIVSFRAADAQSDG